MLTIVIPVYNVENYIRQCLDSVIVSDKLLEKLEVIIVNDGTPDNSGLISHEYEARYPEVIRVIDKENGGHGSAWNLGLTLATGKYIRFLDSDDWLSNLAAFIESIEEVDVDLIFTHLVNFYDDTKVERLDAFVNVKYGEKYSLEDFSFRNVADTSGIYNFHRCTYRTSMLRSECPLFCERVCYDDGILVVAPIILADELVFLDIQLYNYRLAREGQSMNINMQRKHIRDWLPVCRKTIDFVNSHQAISLQKKEERDIVLGRYLDFVFNNLCFCSYGDYSDIMRGWFGIIKDAPYIRLTPEMQLYKYTPTCVSWFLLHKFSGHFIRKSARKAKAIVWRIIHKNDRPIWHQ